MQKWTERDLNPRLPRCERGDHTRLIYRPVFCLKRLEMNLELSVTVIEDNYRSAMVILRRSHVQVCHASSCNRSHAAFLTCRNVSVCFLRSAWVKKMQAQCGHLYVWLLFWFAQDRCLVDV